jgi:hypothetical protein
MFRLSGFAVPLALAFYLSGLTQASTQTQCQVMDPTGTPLNIRTSPNGHIVGTLNNGVLVSVLERSSDNRGRTWVYVRGHEDGVAIGWVYSNYLDCDRDVPEHAEKETVLGCFVRIYTGTHLANHPDQIVTVVKLSIKKVARRVYYDYDFTLQMKLRGRTKILETAGYCKNEGPGIKCQVECDGGGIYVAPHAGHAMMFLDRIRMSVCGKDYVLDGGEDISGGKDDRKFLLDRVDGALCAGM